MEYVIETPSYLKPKIKVFSWTIPMAYMTQTASEAINDLGDIIVQQREQVRAFTNYKPLSLARDITGTPVAFKVLPDPDSLVLLPIEEAVSLITEDKEYDRVKIDGSSEREIVNKIFYALEAELRYIIARPSQWLIYSTSLKTLTRFCWIESLSGEITVRPAGRKNLLLEVDNFKIAPVKEKGVMYARKLALTKEHINRLWSEKVMRELEESLELEYELEESDEGGSEANEAEDLAGGVE